MIQTIAFASRIVEIVGISIIFWGVGVALVGFIRAQLVRNSQVNVLTAITRVRGKLGVYLLLGLEILIASDIAATAIEPTYEKLIVLGGIVVIRTILSFFLSRELEDIGVQPMLEGDGLKHE